MPDSTLHVDQWTALVLAAGKGTRMRSQRPKVLHQVAGRAMVLHVTAALQAAGLPRPLVVVGHGADLVTAALAEVAGTVLQPEQLGTGHAVLQARELLAAGAAQHLLVLNGDMPLVQAATLTALMRQHTTTGAAVTIATCSNLDPRGLGRIVRDASGAVAAIVEEAVATPAQATLREVNVGIYAFALPWLWTQLEALPRNPNGEYYLTDVVAAAVAQGLPIASVDIAEGIEALGVNDRVQLAQAEAEVRQRIRNRLMLSGVTMLDPASTFIDADVTIGEDTVLLPNTLLAGATAIGRDCRIGPGANLRDATIGDGCLIGQATLEECTVEADVDIGPYCHLRPGAYIESHVHLGNYVEIKASRIKSGTQVGHFSYLGDAEIGRNVNIGAGTITCNYDGEHKHRTIIGDGAFIGSDSMLIAPLTIGEGAYTATGAVVTKDVPPGATVAGVPAKPFIRKPPAP